MFSVTAFKRHAVLKFTYKSSGTSKVLITAQKY